MTCFAIHVVKNFLQSYGCEIKFMHVLNLLWTFDLVLEQWEFASEQWFVSSCENVGVVCLVFFKCALSASLKKGRGRYCPVR